MALVANLPVVHLADCISGLKLMKLQSFESIFIGLGGS